MQNLLGFFALVTLVNYVNVKTFLRLRKTVLEHPSVSFMLQLFPVSSFSTTTQQQLYSHATSHIRRQGEWSFTVFVTCLCFLHFFWMEAMCNVTIKENGTEATNTLYAVVFGTVMTLGLPLNAVSLWILLRLHSINSPSAVYMVNLAISDLLLVVSLPMRVYFYATGNWPLSDQACVWITMLFHNNIRSSAIFITFICVDRLLAVVYPLRSRHLRSSSRAWKAAGIVWLCVVLVNIPESVLFSQFLACYKKRDCFEFNPSPPISVISYMQPVLVLTMLVVNIVCTSMVSWTLQRHLNPSVNINNKVNVMIIFIMNLLMFTLFFLPVSLVVLFDSWKPFSTPLLCLASVNCCLDPVLYYFSFDGFWRRKDIDLSLQKEWLVTAGDAI